MAISSDQNFVEPARVKIVPTLPALGEAELGEMFLLTSDGKIYVRITTGWVATAALS
jgi:hypothetical protein